MFDKLKYNNLLISGSKEIQKAKIQVLRKIIQKIQKLKKSVERKPENESSKIKLRKCLSIVESAKKIKKFQALTNILLLEKCPNKIVTNSHSKPEEVAIAMLACNPTMKTLVEKIKQELNLNETELPAWRKTLIQINKHKIKTQRKKKKKLALKAAGSDEKKPKKSKQKSKKITKSAKNKSKLDTKTKTLNGEEKSETKESQLDISIHEKADYNIGNEIGKMIPKTNTPKSPKSKLPSIVDASVEVSAKTEQAKSQKSKPATNMHLKSEDDLLGKTHQKKEMKESDNFRTLNSDFQSHSKAKSQHSQAEIKISKVVDPFFVTTTGENYVAITPAIEDNNVGYVDNVHVSKPRKVSMEPSTKAFKTENHKHPSWLAKQKQRAPVGFQGKRKVFDSTNDQKTSNNNAATELHPSWVAKQKLKPNIAAFQGKKIKFDDE